MWILILARVFIAFSLCFCSPVLDQTQDSKEKRANCVDTWSNIPNPCLNNPGGTVYFPHPLDTKKFIQCDVQHRMYIVQCPTGDIYDYTTSSCSSTNSSTTQSTTPTVPTSTQAPNPCTNANIASGNIYFPYLPDPNKFIQCGPNGLAQMASCNPGMIWNQLIKACVFNTQTTAAAQQTTSQQPIILTPPPTPFFNVNPGMGGSTTPAASGTTVNPCKHKVSNLTELFHSHPNPNKYIQCDLWGNMYVSDCPPNEVWNDISKTCSSPYMQMSTATPIFG